MSVIIRLQNLPISANASNIRRFFGGLSIPEGGVHIVGGNEGDAFIAFATDEDARKAMLLDHQSINGTPVRLYLSSKTEMQSIIESARSSVLFPGTALPLAPLASQKSETMHALDITAPTLPSSFPSYRNGTVSDSVVSETTNRPLSYNKGAVSTTNASVRLPLDSVSRVKNEDYSLIASKVESHDRDASFYATQPPPQLDRRDNFQEPPPFGYRLPKTEHNQPYDSYYDDYDYGRRPPAPNTNDHFRNDRNIQNSTRDRYADYYPPRPTQHNGSQDYRRYPPVQFTPNHSDRFPPDFPNRDFGSTNQTEYRPPSATHSTEPEGAFSNSLQVERDFSVRPPWLNEDVSSNGSKRPFQPQPLDYDEQPRKRKIPPPNRQPSDVASGETDYIVRVVLPLHDVGVKTVFEMLRGVHIVAKWGIRIEEDALQRHTGNILIMLTAQDSYDRALVIDGRKCKNGNIRIFPSTSEEFYNVTDTNFISRCPPEITKKVPDSKQCFPPHYLDGCLELTELSSDATKIDIIQFLGAPGLTLENVTLTQFSQNDKALPSSSNLRALVTLPSANDLKILLSAQRKPFRPNAGLPPIRLTAISKLQLIAYSRPLAGKFDKKYDSSNSPRNQDLPSEKSKTPNLLTCAYLSGLSYALKVPDVIRLFPFVLIPGDAVRMGPDGTTACIDFISENSCRRAISDINKEKSLAKETHPQLSIEAITRSELENRQNSNSNNEDRVNYDRPFKPRDRDPREPRGQWDPRSRQQPPLPHPSSQFNDRPLPSLRSNFEDSYYDRPPPQSFEDFPNEQFSDYGRRSRLRMDNHSTLLPPMSQLDNMGPQRPIMPGRLRQSHHDFVTVFVGNFPPSLNIDQLAGIMRDYYFIPGSIRMRRDAQGQPVGEALVDFKSSYEADRALRGLHGFRIAGRQLILRFEHRN